MDFRTYMNKNYGKDYLDYLIIEGATDEIITIVNEYGEYIKNQKP